MNIRLTLLLATVLLTACSAGDGDYDASGVFECTEVIVPAKANGELLTFAVEEGRQVRQGESLGLVDTLQLSLKRRQLMASLSANDSRRLNEGRQLASLRQQIANTEAERARFAALVSEGAATRKQLDDIDHSLALLRSQLSAAGEQVGSSNNAVGGQGAAISAQVAQIDDQIRQSVVRSPITGTVLAKYMEPGEYAAIGKPLFKVADVSRMTLRAYVSAPQLTSLTVGQTVTVYADQGESGRKAYKGTVSWIADKAEFTPKTIQTRDERANLVYAVKIAVSNDGGIKIGMYGDVKF